MMDAGQARRGAAHLPPGQGWCAGVIWVHSWYPVCPANMQAMRVLWLASVCLFPAWDADAGSLWHVQTKSQQACLKALVGKLRGGSGLLTCLRGPSFGSGAEAGWL